MSGKRPKKSTPDAVNLSTNQNASNALDCIEINGVKYPLMRDLAPYKRNIEKRLEQTSFDRNVFLMMKYRDYNSDLGKYIISLFKGKGVTCIRADMESWKLTGDSVTNPLAVLYCCKYGIALFDEPEDGESFGPNVAYELGIMHYQGKECLILMHKTLTLKKPFDIISKLHSQYDKDLSVERPIKSWIKKIISDLQPADKAKGKPTKKRAAGAKIKPTKKGADPVRTLECKTIVRLLNLAGDCSIIEYYTVLSKKDMIYKRPVELYSFDGSMDWASLNLGTSVLDGGKFIAIEKGEDLPNSKSFLVECSLMKNVPCQFEYHYQWNAMFPESNEAYTIGLVGETTTFRIEYPSHWQVQNFDVKAERGELKPKSKEKGNDGTLQFQQFSFDKSDFGKKARFRWTRIVATPIT